MSKPSDLDRSKLDLSACAQFLLMHLACLLVLWTGLSTAAIVACGALYLVRMFAITAGFHRFFSHRTYRTGRIFQFLMALTATAAYQKGPLWWAAHHRHHHIHTDTVSDLHSPLTRSFWRAHIGWFLSCESKLANHNLVTSLTKYRDLRFLDRYYSLPPILLALATFLLGVLLDQYFPGLQTSGWQMLAWGFFVSTVLLYHGTFTVNSIAHLFGTRRYKTKDNSRNNFLIALITLGEGWHNNHHHYPSSERQGFFWWEIDLTHYTLRMLSYLGVVWDLREPPLKLFTKD